MEKRKTVSETRTILSDIMLPGQANPAGNVHGGEIMKMMDNCAGVAARRHAHKNCVTARVDELMFYHPIFVGQLVICEACLVYVGRSSMEIKVTVRVEDTYGEERQALALSAYFTFVALDENGKPCEVPRLEIQTDEEARAYDEGRERSLRHRRRSGEPPRADAIPR